MKLDIAKVAKLANLTLSEEEEKKFEKQLEETITYIENLDEIDTTDVEPTSQVTGLENVTREDEVKPSLSQEQALSNTKPASPDGGQDGSTQNGFFKVKGILNSE